MISGRATASAGNHPFNGYYAAVINDFGNVAYTLTTSPYNTSYFYDKGRSATVPLGDLGGGETEVFGINDNNIVVGQSYPSMTANSVDAMAWKWNGSTGGTMIDLAGAIGLHSGSLSSNWAINNHNQVTGGVAYAGNNDYINRPYVARRDPCL